MFSFSSLRSRVQPNAFGRAQRFVSSLCLLSLFLALTAHVSQAAAPVSKPTPTPVSGAKLVEVIGSVEVVGEPFKQRFLLTKTGVLPANYIGHYVDLPLPAGKRMVLETISVYGAFPAGKKMFVQFTVSKQNGDRSNDATLMFPLPAISPYGSTDMYANVTPATLRFNTDEHKVSVHIFTNTSNAAAHTYEVSIAGYVEDI